MANEYHPINCPACGAPLTFTGPQTKCPFCGTVVERSEPQKPVEPVVVQISVPTQGRVRPAAPRRGCVSPLVAVLVAVLAAAGLAAYLLRPEGPGTGVLVGLTRNVLGAVIPVASDRQGPDDVLVFTYDSTSEKTRLSYVDGVDRTLRWDSPPLSSNVYKEGIVLGSRKVFVVDQTVLMALEQSDGKVAWQSNLSDSVMSTCAGCLRLVNDTVVVLSQDGVLQAYEAASGRPAWSERLNETPRNLWVVNGQVAVVDYGIAGEVDRTALQLRDPATGKVVRSIPGVCGSEYHGNALPIYDPTVLVSPTGSDIYFLYGLLPGCIQRWNAESGQMVWQTLAEDHYLDRFTASPLLVDGTIYASYNGRIIAVNAENGKLRLLADEEDYELTLQGERDGRLIVMARRQRGSERYELWGLDPATGQVPWKYIPQDEKPIDAPGGWATDKGFACHLTREGVTVLHLQAEPPTLAVETLNPQTGQETMLAASSLDDDYWAGLAWGDDYAWLTVRSKVHIVDLASGKVLSTWP